MGGVAAPSGGEIISQRTDPTGDTQASVTRSTRPPDLAAMAERLAARSGHGRFSCGMSVCLSVLCSQFLRFDAADADWADRDRLVLSAPEGTELVEAMLVLTGQRDESGLTLDQQPELLPPVAGGTAQGVALGAGIALGERLLARRFGRSLVDHRAWVLCRASELGSGLALEAAALAGRQRLDKLVVLADAASDGPAADEDEEAVRCLPALGWAVRSVDGQDSQAVAAALSWAVRGRKPTLIVCRTGKPSSDGGTAAAPRAGGGHAALADAAWDATGHRGAATRRAWLKRLTRHPQRLEYERALAGRLPDDWAAMAAKLRLEIARDFGAAGAERCGEALLAQLSAGLVEFACCGTTRPQQDDATAPRLHGFGPPHRQVGCGARERGMAFLVAGMALHGGSLACGVATLAAADAVRPALRAIARCGRRALQVMIEEASHAGTRGGIEQLAALRAIPGMRLMRPGDPVELAECFELALRSPTTPTALVLPGRAMAVLRADGGESLAARGGYVFAEADGVAAGGDRHATLLATGSELRLALRLRQALARLGKLVAVVSLPCWSLFAQQSRRYRDAVLGSAPRFGLEASSGFGWERWLGADGHFVGAWTPGGGDDERHVNAIAQQLAQRLDGAARR